MGTQSGSNTYAVNPYTPLTLLLIHAYIKFLVQCLLHDRVSIDGGGCHCW